MKITKFLSVATLAVALTAAMSACGSKNQTAESAEAVEEAADITPDTPEEAEDEIDEIQEGDPETIVFVTESTVTYDNAATHSEIYYVFTMTPDGEVTKVPYTTEENKRDPDQGIKTKAEEEEYGQWTKHVLSYNPHREYYLLSAGGYWYALNEKMTYIWGGYKQEYDAMNAITEANYKIAKKVTLEH